MLRQFRLVVTNAGFGPALNVRVEVIDARIGYKQQPIVAVPTLEPYTIPVGRSLEFEYTATKNPDDLGGAFENPNAVGEGEVAGVARARFHDIYGREFGAEAPLEGGRS